MYLDSVDADYDPQRDLVLGPWCVIGAEFDPLTVTLPEFVEPFASDAERAQARYRVEQLTRLWIARLADDLNRRHGTHFPIDFWHTLSAPWIDELITRAWMRWSVIARVITHHGDRPIEATILTGERRWPFRQSGDMMNAIQRDPEFSWWLDSELLAAQAPPSWRLRHRPLAPAPSPIKKLHADDPTATPARFHRVKASLAWGDFIHSPGASALVALYVNLLPRRRSTYVAHVPPEVDALGLFPAEFLGVLEKLIDATIPWALREDFAALLAYSRKIVFRPGRLRIGTLSRWNEYDKMVVALARVAGEKVVQYQHGSGDYGSANATPATNLIEFRSDAFITWGWSAQGDYDANFVPLPSPWLSRYAARRRSTDGRAIFVAPTQRYRMTRLNSGWRATAGVAEIRDILRFIDGLSTEVRQNLAYRPYRHGNSEVDDGKLVQRYFPDMPLVSGNIEDQIVRCRLYLGTGLSTTLNVAMAANVPVVFYFDPELFPLCRQAKSYFDALCEVGILHYDPLDAARLVSRIWPDVEGWWSNPQVRDAHRAWVRKFARAEPRGWALTWAKALRRL